MISKVFNHPPNIHIKIANSIPAYCNSDFCFYACACVVRALQVMKRHYDMALASFRPSGGRGMQEWREVVPEILHPLIDHDRRHLVDVITKRCPWLLPNNAKRGSVTPRDFEHARITRNSKPGIQDHR